MPDFKAKMHQIRFRLGLRPRPGWGANSAPPDPLAGLRGPTSEGRERGGGEGRREGEGRPPNVRDALTPLGDPDIALARLRSSVRVKLTLTEG